MRGDSWFKRNEFGVSGGIGVSYTLKEKVSFTFEVRTNLGLRDIQDGLPYSEFKYNKLNTLNFLFGVTHHLTSFSKAEKNNDVQ